MIVNSGVLPNDPLVRNLSQIQIEAYRHVLYDQKKIEQEFWVELLHQSLTSGIKALSNMIVYKMGVLLNGGDLTEAMGIGEEEGASDTSSSLSSFADALNLSEDDIKLLKREGVNLSSLTVAKQETINGNVRKP